MCQSNWSIGVPKYLVKITLGIFMSVFWMRLKFELEDFVKQNALSHVGVPDPIS